MTPVIPLLDRMSHAPRREVDGYSHSLPDLAHWKAQVKCQAGCPVATDAGRYVQLIADGRAEEAYWWRVRRTLSRRCAGACAPRRAKTPAAAAPSMRRSPSARSSATSPNSTAWNRSARTPRTSCATTDVHEGNRYAGHLPLPSIGSAPPRRHGPRRRVAVIGAGPAGLAAAHDLALLNYDVAVFEAAANRAG